MSLELYWHTPYACIYEDQAIRLLRFSEGSENLLIVPPQSGQHSYIADLGKEQSVVECAIQNTSLSVHAIEWKSCTVFRINEGIEDLLDQVATCVDILGGKTHLAGMSQGGWLSAIYTALYSDQILSLTVAGAPIDTHAGNSGLKKIVSLPLTTYYGVLAMGGGMMRGKMVYNAMKSAFPMLYMYHRHISPDKSREKINEWRESGQNLAGKWFIWAIKNIFKDNRLGKNELCIGDKIVDLRNIRCPVNIVTGSADEIVPSEQTLALRDHIESEVQCYSVEEDHEGVFASKESIQTVWKPLLLRMI